MIFKSNLWKIVCNCIFQFGWELVPIHRILNIFLIICWVTLPSLLASCARQDVDIKKIPNLSYVSYPYLKSHSVIALYLSKKMKNKKPKGEGRSTPPLIISIPIRARGLNFFVQVPCLFMNFRPFISISQFLLPSPFYLTTFVFRSSFT